MRQNQILRLFPDTFHFPCFPCFPEVVVTLVIYGDKMVTIGPTKTKLARK